MKERDSKRTVPTTTCGSWECRSMSQCNGPPEKQVVSTPSWDPSPENQSLVEESKGHLVWKSAGILPSKKRWEFDGKTGSLLKGHHTTVLPTTHPGAMKIGWLGVHWEPCEEAALCDSGRELKGWPLGALPVLSPSPTMPTDAITPGSCPPFPMA